MSELSGTTEGRIVIKRIDSALTPTLGTNSDVLGSHQTEGWTNSNIYQSELITNLFNNKFYVGLSDQVYKVILSKDDNNLVSENNDYNGSHNFMWGNNSEIESGDYNLVGGGNHFLSGNSYYNLVSCKSNYLAGDYNLVGGSNNSIEDDYNLVAGRQHNVVGHDNTVLSRNNNLNGDYNLVTGKDNIIDSNYHLVMGLSNEVSGVSNLVVGINNQVGLDSNYNKLLSDSNIISGTTYSSILGGSNNTIYNLDKVAILASSNITASESDVVYVPKLILNSGISSGTTEGTLFYDGSNFKGFNGLTWTNLGGNVEAKGGEGIVQFSDGSGEFTGSTYLSYDTSNNYLDTLEIHTNYLYDRFSNNGLDFSNSTYVVINCSLYGSNNNGPGFLDENASSTNPTILPNKSDIDTGLGGGLDGGNPFNSLIVNGVEKIRTTTSQIQHLEDYQHSTNNYNNFFELNRTSQVGNDTSNTVLYTYTPPTNSICAIHVITTYFNEVNYGGGEASGLTLLDNSWGLLKNVDDTLTRNGMYSIIGPYGSSNAGTPYTNISGTDFQIGWNHSDVNSEGRVSVFIKIYEMST